MPGHFVQDTPGPSSITTIAATSQGALLANRRNNHTLWFQWEHLARRSWTQSSPKAVHMSSDSSLRHPAYTPTFIFLFLLFRILWTPRPLHTKSSSSFTVKCHLLPGSSVIHKINLLFLFISTALGLYLSCNLMTDHLASYSPWLVSPRLKAHRGQKLQLIHPHVPQCTLHNPVPLRAPRINPFIHETNIA